MAVRRERITLSWDVDSSLKLSSGELEESLEGIQSRQDNGEGLTNGDLPSRCFEKERNKWKIERRNRPSHALLLSLGKDLGSVPGLLLEIWALTLRGGYHNRPILHMRKLRLQEVEYLAPAATSHSDSRVGVLNHCALLAKPLRCRCRGVEFREDGV